MNLPLPYLLQPENICYFDDNFFYIGNRKTFPKVKEFYKCNNCLEISIALGEMITQGGGPLQVALTSFRYIARLMDRNIIPFSYIALEENINLIKNARKTNTTMSRCINEILQEYNSKMKNEYYSLCDFIIDINNTIDKKEKEFDDMYNNMGKYGASLIKDNDTILTTCFAEHSFLLSLFYAKEMGKRIKVLVNETRPYFQGTRLTAPSIYEMNIDVEIISDAMGSFFMQRGEINQYMSAADLVCMDGTVVNKIGTNQNAICANYYNIDYTAFAMSPDKNKNSFEDITIEYRDSKELLEINGEIIGDNRINALYPAFDIIESKLVTNIVTNKGIFKPNEIKGVYRWTQL